MYKEHAKMEVLPLWTMKIQGHMKVGKAEPIFMEIAAASEICACIYKQ